MTALSTALVVPILIAVQSPAAAHAVLDEVMNRLAKADTRAKELETIDARIGSLAESVREAREETARLTAPAVAADQTLPAAASVLGAVNSLGQVRVPAAVSFPVLVRVPVPVAAVDRILPAEVDVQRRDN